MSPRLYDDSVFDEEEGLRTDVRIGIELALSDVLANDEQREITSVEEEKLTHFAIRDLDLQLTYSWYLAGAHTVARANPDKRSPWQPGRALGTVQSSPTDYTDERIGELRAYFRSAEFIPGYTLRDVWFTGKFDFLRDYYRELAPEKYRDLYVHSLNLREWLWELNDTLDRKSKNATLSDFGDTEPKPLLAPATEEEIRYSVSDFHMDLAGIEELNPIKKDVARGTDTIERILSKLTHTDTIDVDQRMVVDKDVHDFFYYSVWKYPALAISADTARGPNAQAINRRRLLEFDGFDDTLDTERDSITRKAREIGLLPDVDEPISADSEKSAYLHALLKESVNPE
ncbi:hypothetical protein [Halococcus sp. AFM35]|uniref:hypothetical protein n=1 Tax=Halococcus sp. AFM35 TaxID=3421653 RepID=UPI003EBB0A8F